MTASEHSANSSGQVVVLAILLTSSTRKEVEFSEVGELVRKRKGPWSPKTVS